MIDPTISTIRTDIHTFQHLNSYDLWTSPTIPRQRPEFRTPVEKGHQYQFNDNDVRKTLLGILHKSHSISAKVASSLGQFFFFRSSTTFKHGNRQMKTRYIQWHIFHSVYNNSCYQVSDSFYRKYSRVFLHNSIIYWWNILPINITTATTITILSCL